MSYREITATVRGVTFRKRGLEGPPTIERLSWPVETLALHGAETGPRHHQTQCWI